MTTASVCEQILAQVQSTLLTAGIVADRVFRGRRAPLDGEEFPAIKIKRGPSDSSSHATRVERVRFEFLVSHLVLDGETSVDALHVAAHAVLMSDAALGSIGYDLRLLATDTESDEADITADVLTARYQIQFLTRPGDVTRNLS